MILDINTIDENIWLDFEERNILKRCLGLVDKINSMHVLYKDFKRIIFVDFDKCNIRYYIRFKYSHKPIASRLDCEQLELSLNTIYNYVKNEED